MMWIENKLKEIDNKFGKIPEVFCPYQLSDLSDGVIPTITTANAGGYGCRGGITK